jgi:hypothetical protein
MRAAAIFSPIVIACGLLQTVFAQPEVQNPPQPPSSASNAVIGNDGTPMLLPFRCSDEDIRLGGLSCSDDSPCPIFVEISSVEALGNMVLLTGNIHSEAATLYSVLLASDDNGHTWREPIARVRGAGLDHIEFSGTDTAWISGQELVPLPQNPFLLSTTDGGRTWRAREVLSEDSEIKFGSVQQFFFTNKENGTMIIDHGAGAGGDRYTLYETENGGDTWSIKQASAKPIVVKRPTPPPVSDWRVRTDASLKSFVVEHHVGARWSSVAAFLVKLDPCKPADPAKIP